MGRPNKIRLAGKEAVVRKMAANGVGYREIADALRADHGVDISHMAVARFITEETDERRDAAKSVAAQDATETVTLVTSVLRELIEMNAHAARISYVNEAGGGTQSDPKPIVSALKDASNATVQAAKTLQAVTMGDEKADPLAELQSRLVDALKDKRRRESGA